MLKCLIKDIFSSHMQCSQIAGLSSLTTGLGAVRIEPDAIIIYVHCIAFTLDYIKTSIATMMYSMFTSLVWEPNESILSLWKLLISSPKNKSR